MAQHNAASNTSFDNVQWVGGDADGRELASRTRARWDWSTIDESFWSANWPYQLAVLEARPNNTYFQRDVYTLPINPESLTNSMPFATSLQATFGGVVENNGGVPLRPIVLTGNLGVINERESGDDLVELLSTSGIGGGTIEGTVTSLGDQLINKGLNLYEEAVPGVSAGVPERSTGYYQWLFLQRFLESYAEMKKTDVGDSLRLALYVWKEQAAWLISPENLTLTRTANQPVEYQYTFKATAYARVNPLLAIDGAGSFGSTVIAVREAGEQSALASALAAMESARATVKKYQNLAIAIDASFEKVVGGVLRSSSLLLKDTVGAVKTWADFPDTIKNTAYRLINDQGGIYQNLLSGGSSKVPSSAATLVTATVDLTSIDDLQVDALSNSTPALRTAMAKETARVRAFTTQDFQDMRSQVEQFNSFFAASVGLPDPRDPNPPPAQRPATTADYKLMSALASASDALSQMLVVQREAPTTSLLDYVAGLASTAGINMRRAYSKFAVPFPYGSTLEQLSLQYLGDASRWGEIAALNELRQPYIDEVGQDQALLANGSGNSVVISDGSLLQVNHLVSISSDQELAERRVVEAIKELAPGYWNITLSGAEDLNRFKLSDGAKLHFFLPGTVNSSKVIFIPSSQPTTNDDLRLRYVPTFSDLEQLLQVGGVDGLLTDKGDIAITQDGDWPYVQGLGALIQWARIALNTPLGSWVSYPTFGIALQVGESLADVTAKDILASVKNSFRLNDAFVGVSSAFIDIKGPAVQVTLELGVKGVDTSLPVTFDIVQ